MFVRIFDWLWSRRPSAAEQLLGDVPFTIRKGHRYRATVTLSFFEQLAATNDMIRDKLTAAGFTNVTVKGDGETRQAEGVWGKPDASAALDDHLSAIVEVA